MNTDSLADSNQLADLLFVGRPVRIEHTWDSRHSHQISISLHNVAFGDLEAQIRAGSKLIIAVRRPAIEGVVVIHKSHSVPLQSLTAERVCILLQFTITAADDGFPQLIFLLEIKDHRVRVTLLQMSFLAGNTIP